MKITATIITLNEELHIVRAIESLRCCDEILVLDSGSADRTMELAEKLGARVLESPWRGYAGQKNWAAEQATHDWILHSGWYPDRKVRLYNRQKAKWVGDFVHESVQVRGRLGHLESNLLHFTCDSLSEHLRTMDRYTTLAAEELVSRKTPLGWRHLILDPTWTFLKTYFVQGGFLDGVEGLTIAYMAALYTFLKYAKARNMSS